MGQKVNPTSLRLPLTKKWSSLWFNKQNYRTYLLEDLKIRDFCLKKLGSNGAVARIEISRNQNQIKIDIYSSRPGVIIGRSGQGITDLKTAIIKVVFKSQNTSVLVINIIEIKVPELSAELVAQNIGNQISHRIAYRKAAKQAMEKTMLKGALGIKIQVSGRLNGAEIARSEKFNRGSVPLGTFKANIDFAICHAKTTYGVVGVKVWLYKKPEEE